MINLRSFLSALLLTSLLVARAQTGIAHREPAANLHIHASETDPNKPVLLVRNQGQSQVFVQVNGLLGVNVSRPSAYLHVQDPTAVLRLEGLAFMEPKKVRLLGIKDADQSVFVLADFPTNTTYFKALSNQTLNSNTPDKQQVIFSASDQIINDLVLFNPTDNSFEITRSGNYEIMGTVTFNPQKASVSTSDKIIITLSICDELDNLICSGRQVFIRKHLDKPTQISTNQIYTELPAGKKLKMYIKREAGSAQLGTGNHLSTFNTFGFSKSLQITKN